jgi:hypothetical protein
MSTQPDDPPVTPESVRRAIDAANAERQRFTRATGKVIPLHPLPSEEDYQRRDGIDALTLLVEAHGVETVYSWLRNLATAAGKEL